MALDLARPHLVRFLYCHCRSAYLGLPPGGHAELLIQLAGTYGAPDGVAARLKIFRSRDPTDAAAAKGVSWFRRVREVMRGPYGDAYFAAYRILFLEDARPQAERGRAGGRLTFVTAVRAARSGLADPDLPMCAPLATVRPVSEGRDEIAFCQSAADAAQPIVGACRLPAVPAPNEQPPAAAELGQQRGPMTVHGEAGAMPLAGAVVGALAAADDTQLERAAEAQAWSARDGALHGAAGTEARADEAAAEAEAWPDEEWPELAVAQGAQVVQRAAASVRSHVADGGGHGEAASAEAREGEAGRPQRRSSEQTLGGLANEGQDAAGGAADGAETGAGDPPRRSSRATAQPTRFEPHECRPAAKRARRALARLPELSMTRTASGSWLPLRLDHGLIEGAAPGCIDRRHSQAPHDESALVCAHRCSTCGGLLCGWCAGWRERHHLGPILPGRAERSCDTCAAALRSSAERPGVQVAAPRWRAIAVVELFAGLLCCYTQLHALHLRGLIAPVRLEYASEHNAAVCAMWDEMARASTGWTLPATHAHDELAAHDPCAPRATRWAPGDCTRLLFAGPPCVFDSPLQRSEEVRGSAVCALNTKAVFLRAAECCVLIVENVPAFFQRKAWALNVAALVKTGGYVVLSGAAGEYQGAAHGGADIVHARADVGSVQNRVRGIFVAVRAELLQTEEQDGGAGAALARVRFTEHVAAAEEAARRHPDTLEAVVADAQTFVNSGALSAEQAASLYTTTEHQRALIEGAAQHAHAPGATTVDLGRSALYVGGKGMQAHIGTVTTSSAHWLAGAGRSGRQLCYLDYVRVQSLGPCVLRACVRGLAANAEAAGDAHADEGGGTRSEPSAARRFTVSDVRAAIGNATEGRTLCSRLIALVRMLPSAFQEYAQG